MKLSQNERELLDGLKSGKIRLYYMSGLYPYYFRNDTMKRCTKAAESLQRKDLIKNIKKTYYDRDVFEVTELGKAT